MGVVRLCSVGKYQGNFLWMFMGLAATLTSLLSFFFSPFLLSFSKLPPLLSHLPFSSSLFPLCSFFPSPHFISLFFLSPLSLFPPSLPSSLPPLPHPQDFGSIFSMLLPGTSARLSPPEGLSVLDGLEVKVAFGGIWKESLSELSGGQR